MKFEKKWFCFTLEKGRSKSKTVVYNMLFIASHFSNIKTFPNYKKIRGMKIHKYKKLPNKFNIFQYFIIFNDFSKLIGCKILW
jgi:hypothetical protein